ncbi:histone-lysine N-methyltransferase SETMAR-like [Octopus bimaculoides]|uniref:histone-lysine N-methyltransferase SETMAR-like n=1 Tax=Octopus bimaculoides TaxID=37653 RepID=UPI00071D9F51|nr:histone-lysine N-methyltransferase SETMAR-like [Octopus bimaculoides]|eukprot:XP_014771382.1 PREDICTED: histone-lysine N-methyltransferase SETMAR-like [Octopus bimaculoides]
MSPVTFTRWIRSKPHTRSVQGVFLQHDNSRPHVDNLTKTDIQELGWEVLPHPLYSPDITLSDYHIFWLLSNSLQAVSMNNDVGLRMWLDKFFEPKPGDYYHQDIDKLVER